MADYEIEQIDEEQWVVRVDGVYRSTFASEEAARDGILQMGDGTMQERGVQARPEETPRPVGPAPEV